jgi:hypothetical protein
MNQPPTEDTRNAFYMNSIFEEMVSDAITDENEDAYRSDIDEETTSFPKVTVDPESSFSNTEPAVVSEENSLNYDHLVPDSTRRPGTVQPLSHRPGCFQDVLGTVCFSK